ncbi:MAG: trypsin-like peptidase domain-containing protein [Euryarchaeota archaeon]|jgi:S1-C subfamily serine protease|nr:trypsin-like peptidase domain-containing protein [Euryarchaeota archaeon]
MNESLEIKKKSKNKNIIVFVAIGVATMFIVGYFVGGSLSSLATSSKTDSTQLQGNVLEDNTTLEEIHNITYYYNTTSLAQLYKDVKDSVVVITGYVEQYSFFGRQYSEVQGSGFIYDYKNDMVVVTNKHVVNDAINITVTFANGDGYPATVIGSDAYSDLAVLSVEAPPTEFHPLDITSSSNLQVGDPVVALGSPFGLGGTMTTGIISQLGRTIQDSVAGNFPVANIIQTSAAINPGNSGGPLFNYQGEVIGITTAIIQNSNGLGFAVPSNTILREIGSLITTGSYNQHPWVGISGTDMTYAIAQSIGVNVTYGWLITQISDGGAAAQAGLQGGDQQVWINDARVVIGGDIIVAVDGTRIINGDTFMSYLEEHSAPNQTIQITIIRNHQFQDFSVELKQRPNTN